MMCAKRRETANKPEFKEACRKRMLARWDTKEHRQKVTQSCKDMWLRPEYLEKMKHRTDKK